MNRAELESLDKTSLVQLVLRQAARIAELESRQAGLEGRLVELERRFAEPERQSIRGAAPFARPQDERSASPCPRAAGPKPKR
jgi:hypothetical protein